MASGAQQLAADFEQVQNRLLSYPGINILETEGDPPDRYDIEYTLKGYELKSDGSVTPANKHKIRITLPFGYPHFPPNVKPLTSIFHPDIDPDAIRIADFWQDNKSLADLIIHIGRMICGISYQREEPFNQEAYNWYEERQDWLPFDTLEPVEGSGDTAAVQEVPQDLDEEITRQENQEESVSSPGGPLDILNEDLDFPFDEDQEVIDLDLGDESRSTDRDDLTFDLDLMDGEPDEDIEIDLFADEPEVPGEDLTLSLEEERTGESGEYEEGGQDLHDLTGEAAPDEESTQPADQAAGEDESEPAFDLPGENDKEISFDILDEEEMAGAAEKDSDEQDIFDLTGDTDQVESTQPADQDPGADESELVFDMPGEDEEEISFDLLDEEEKADQQERFEYTGDGDEEQAIDLGDLEELDEEDQPVSSLEDKNNEEISLDLLDDKTEEADTDGEFPAAVDLSGLEKEDQLTEEDIAEQPPLDNDAEDFSFGTEDESDSSSDFETEENIDEESLAGLELDDAFREESVGGNGSGKSRAIRPLLDQKKMFTAKKVLADVPDPGTIPDLEELEEQITHAITRAEDLFRKADKLEQAGELEKAGLTLDLVANEAVDYPGLEFARNRIRESLLAKDSSEDTRSTDDLEKETGTKKKKKRKKRGFSRPGFSLPYRIIAIVAVLIAILAAATFVTFKDTNNIKLAYTEFQKAEQLLGKKEFKQAQQALQSAAAALANIIILQKDEREKLRKKIKAITDSEDFQEGLKGRVLYDGKYVTVAMAKKIDTFNSLMRDAEARHNSGEIDKAIQYYQQAAETAKQIDFAEQEKTIRQTINRLQLDKALKQARQAEEEQEWKQAADTYAQALELSKNLSTSSDKIDIESKLAAAAFRHELTEGQRAFTASDWQKTIEMLQSAEQILNKNPGIATESEKAEIRKLLIYSRLYHILSGAKIAFGKEEWELAVNQYKNAIYLLEDNKEMLGNKAETSIRKIEKTILMTEISREQHKNAVAIEKNDQRESLESYRTIAALIQNSSFKDDETLGKILEDATSQIVTLKNEIRINSRVEWLEQNYEEIFRTMYPSARSSELLNPQVTFIREEGDKLIFTMSCVEKRQGRSFRLQLNYQYDQKLDAWDIYSGEL